MVNIFFTDWDPIVAARDSCDSYVIKIPIEVCTILSAVHWRTGYNGPVGSGLPLIFESNTQNVLPAIGPYKDSRAIKSSSEIYQWLIKSRGNYDYAIKYGLKLVEEYKRRYKPKFHNSEGVLIWLKQNIPDIPDGPMTTDVGLAMPDIYKNRSNPTLSYKMYLVHEKYNVLQWKNASDVPAWYREMATSYYLYRTALI